MVALFFAVASARADQDLDVLAAKDRDGRQEITTAAAADSDQANLPAIVVRVDWDGILSAATGISLDTSAGILNFLSFDSQVLDGAEVDDLDISPPSARVAAGARRNKSWMGAIGGVLAPASLVLTGTALASFAFFARRKPRPSRRLYYSKHSLVARPPARIPTPQTSPCAGSCEPSRRENSVHSSPRKRLA
ncbi:MAG: hypothetical protein HYX25_02500 [Candidatus Solibacter usitatus]|nr:hypothetical protein [Candidatus Solibacter usitatus]